MTILLASASVTRAAILREAGIAFTVCAPAIDEATLKQDYARTATPAENVALRLAEAKAKAIAQKNPQSLVIGADQVLQANGTLFDKPATIETARQQLKMLRGHWHRLIAAVVLAQGDGIIFRYVAEAQMKMRRFSDGFLEDYVQAEGDGLLASVGAYRLEGRGAQLFDAIEGDWTAILGLPLPPLLQALRQQGAIAS